MTEIVNDTKPCYEIDNLPVRYSEAILKKTVKNERKSRCYENLKFYLVQTKSKFRRPSELTLINLFVNTKAYPRMSLGTTPSNLSSTSIA